MNKQSSTYRQCKLLWELTHSTVWTEILKPMLAEKSNAKPDSITSLDDAFRAAKTQGSSDYARFLLATVEGRAQQFVRQQTGYINAAQQGEQSP